MALYTLPYAPIPIGYIKVNKSSGLLGMDNTSLNFGISFDKEKDVIFFIFLKIYIYNYIL